jgi:hypothetical protein
VALDSKGSNGEGLRRGALNGYIKFLQKQSKIMEKLMVALNLMWTLEVPVEMLVQRFMGMSVKYRFIVLNEFFK